MAARHVVGEAADGETAVSLIRDERPDLVLLDRSDAAHDRIRRGCRDFAGVDADGHLRTAYDQYALRAFEVSACDYLLKPFDEDRLALAMQRALERHDQRTQLDGARTPLAPGRSAAVAGRANHLEG